MKKLLFATIVTLGSFAFGQSQINDGFRDGDPAYLVPTQEQQKNGQCNENAVSRDTWIESGYTVVKCTGPDELFFLYVVPKNGGGGNTLPGTITEPTLPGDRE